MATVNIPELVLIAEEWHTDGIGQKIAIESYREILAEISSATRAEVFNGGRNGLNPELVAVTAAVNYEGERLASVGEIRYNIYRTYRRGDSDEIELYLERRSGS